MYALVDIDESIGEFVFTRSLTGFASLLVTERHLIYEMTRRAISEQFKGQLFGLIWPFVHPLMIVFIYLFIFGIVFGSRIQQPDGSEFNYPAYILSGMIPWLGIVVTLNAASTCLRAHGNLVKQVVFPIEVIPVKTVANGFFGQSVGLVAVLVYMTIIHGYVPWTFALIPLLYLIQFVFMCGISFILAALTPFFRDLSDFTRVFSQIGIYSMPIIYRPEWVPAKLEFVLWLNPFSHLIWCYQDVIYFARIDHPWSWLIISLLAVFTAAIGWNVFGRLRGLLGNVL